MLERVGRNHADFWSLDVEGAELDVLRGVAWSDITIDSILVEDFWLSNRHLDRLMTDPRLGYLKVRQLAIDSFWVSKAHHLRQTLVADSTSSWDSNEQFRKRAREGGRLSTDL